MKKFISSLASAGIISSVAFAGDIQLPLPDKHFDVKLIEALENRHSERNFIKKDIDLQTISNVLWVAYGVNRDDGHRTIPTAMNEKDLNIYVVNKDGAFLYDADKNLLKQVSDKNNLSLFQKQEYMLNVPLVLVYTGSNSDWAKLHAGSAYQNVGLYTAVNDLSSIVRAYYDAESVAKALNLPDGQQVIISQAVGWKR